MQDAPVEQQRLRTAGLAVAAAFILLLAAVTPAYAALEFGYGWPILFLAALYLFFHLIWP
jgi:hypothetical protein